MECRDVRDLADSFLSEQLLVETTHDVVRHLETCPGCRAEIALRRNMRAQLRSAWARSDELAPRTTFAAELAAKLHATEVNAATISRRSVLQSWWALAAGVVLAAGGGLFVRESRARSRLTALARTAAGDHQNCAIRFNLAERPIPMAEAARLYGEPYAALESFELPSDATPLTAIERHACVYDGHRFGHIVFRTHDTIGSLLVTDGRSPSAPQLEPVAGGPAVASVPAGPFVAFVVADLDGDEVLKMAQALAAPLSHRFV
jgi:hypothetical protein